ncbi:MAG: DUF255 domain-containing protein [Candidatus Thiodiazotropha sp.]
MQPRQSSRGWTISIRYAMLGLLSLHLHAETSGESSMPIPQTLLDAYHAKGPDYRPRTEHLREDGSPRFINRLILEDSPYLLQHAHNPVDWYPWSETAFAKARAENKPVFLSIGYATCHWCHVMERESFENLSIAERLNRDFVAIKVDRETHPDVDQVYMDAVLLTTGQGGWPMSSFLTPGGKPFYAGTYYPPTQFESLLGQVSELWQTRREELQNQADRVARAVAEQNRINGQARSLDEKVFEQAVGAMQKSFDDLQGGFGQAPKFPREPWLHLLLDRAERQSHPDAGRMLIETLDHMARGGIHDQVGGGFHRYSTDYEWLVPHFEKMLYNQAHLARLYLQAWRISGRTDLLRIATRTLDYVAREMTAPDGGFYSATDADSEGEEGLFFTWTKAELKQTLSEDDFQLARSVYPVHRIGNFEGRTILHMPEGFETLAQRLEMPRETLIQEVDRINDRLREVRNRRPPPLRDEKIISAWNGMMIVAFAQAAALLERDDYRQVAERAAETLWRRGRPESGRLWRVLPRDAEGIPATLEDYACVAEAYLALYDLSWNQTWLERARELADALLARFHDPEQGGFFLNEADLGLTAMGRPRDEGSDNAVPSGSSVAVRVLQQLARRTDHPGYREATQQLLSRFAPALEQAPYSYAYLLTAAAEFLDGELSPWGYAGQGQIRARGRITPVRGAHRLEVELSMPEGWHIQSNQPLGDGQVATRMNLRKDSGGWTLGPVTYPPGETRSLGFQTQPVSVYAGKLTLQALLEAREENSEGTYRLPLELRLQACNDRLCLPPETLTLWLSPARR